MRCPTESGCIQKKRLTDADLTDSHYTLAIKLCKIFAFSTALVVRVFYPMSFVRSLVRFRMHRIQSSVVGLMLLKKVWLLSQSKSQSQRYGQDGRMMVMVMPSTILSTNNTSKTHTHIKRGEREKKKAKPLTFQ